MISCPNCKNLIDPSSKICPYCGFRLDSNYGGYPPPPPQPPYPQPSTYPSHPQTNENNLNNVASIAGIIIGIISLIAWILPFCGCPLSIIGLGASIYGSLSEKSRIMGIIGVVLNLIGLVISLLNGVCGALMFMSNN